MAFASASSARAPLSEMNTTPLIDVMLVLLIMLIMTIPLSTNSLAIDLPPRDPAVHQRPHAVRNLLAVERDGDLLWNGKAVTEAQLAALLAEVRTMRPEPEVQFRPEPDASYERSARVLLIVERSRVTRFGFLDNERYRRFDRPR